VGSEMSGGAANIAVRGVTCTGVGEAFYVKTVQRRQSRIRSAVARAVRAGMALAHTGMALGRTGMALARIRSALP
jgi:hypothetical protein